MWNRKEVKARARKSLSNNFWKGVLVTLILGVVGGGVYFGGGGGNSIAAARGISNLSNHKIYEIDKQTGKTVAPIDEKTELESVEDLLKPIKEEAETEKGGVDVKINDKEMELGDTPFYIFAGMLILTILIAAVVVSGITVVIDSALIKPIIYGGKRFFHKNLDEPAKVANLMYVFDHNHTTVFKTSLCVTVFEFLWSLLFIVPGIVKHYEYKMIPYLLTENPEMTRKEAFAESKRLMKGNKWKAFVLDLSFIGWDILSLCTCGILGIFYVNPYKNAAEAALYEAVKA